jgi:23S rRNA (cytosine1962-C5)-methyltransferase
MTRPAIHLQTGTHKRLVHGHPWGYSNEIRMDAAAKAIPAGSLVRVLQASGEAVGVATFNPHVLISVRLLSRDAGADLDAAFFRARFARALALRSRLFAKPYYRLVHAESDGLPGLIVDRFGDVLVAQFNTAGMDRLREPIVEALRSLLSPRAIIARNDSPSRGTEGLGLSVELVHGELGGLVTLEENDAKFFCDPLDGQKTGWFYDHRPNRAFIAGLARGKRVLDLYCYAGAFSVPCALAGATQVTAVDRSEQALAMAARSAETNGVQERIELRRGEVFRELEAMVKARQQWDIVIADPPAFVKSRKDLAQGLRGYRKLARMAADCVAPSGLLLIASCSHNVDTPAFALEVSRGLTEAGRTGRIIFSGGAGPDHPVHPFLAESAYLKCQVLELD